jgi:hypothetical protein
MRFVIVTCFAVASLLPIYGQKTTPKPSYAVELDFTKLALQPEALVARVLGTPKRINKPAGAIWTESFYPWGFAHYEQGRFKAFQYDYKQVPSSISEALEKVGLKQTSAPNKTPFMIYWDKAGPLVCCGLEMESVVVVQDFSKIIVRFNRRIDGQKPK